jgi:two-component system, chemotaxis family, sensor kinase CheA
VAAEADPRWQQLRAAFRAELDERARELNRLLLGMEQTSEAAARRDTFDALFREAHNLKGAARAVGLADVERLAHALEASLDAARRADSRPPPAWFDAVYSAVDTLVPLYQATEGADGAVRPNLSAVLDGLVTAQPTPGAAVADGDAAPRAVPLPAPSPEGRADFSLVTARPDQSASAPSGAEPAAPDRGALPLRAPDVGSPTGATESVRVAVEKLDALLAAAGELVVAQQRVQQRLVELRELSQHMENWRRERRRARGLRTRLRRLATEGAVAGGRSSRELEALLRFDERAEGHSRGVSARVDEITSRLRDDSAQLTLVAHSIEHDVLAVRLMPLSAVLGPFERLVRDLTRAQGKRARLVLEGGDTEIDRRILEQVRDPLMHMLRNAVDHGIEPPAERVAQGKPAEGCIRLVAQPRGGAVAIALSDDGAGLHPDRLREAAVRKGLLTAEQAAVLDDAAARDLIFRPGFSSTEAVTETSGRGVGMDVVRVQVEGLHGAVTVESTPGAGTQITLTVPVTLATTRALVVRAGGELYAVPSAPVERTARVRPSELVWLEGRRAIDLGGHPVPVAELADVLQRPRDAAPADAADGWRPLFLLGQAERRLALLVDELVVEQEIVIKPLGWPLQRVRNVAGVAVLGSGQTVVILNPADLVKSAAGLANGSPLVRSGGDAAGTAPAPAVRRPRVLVVDDSITTRTLERSILESAGYDVRVAEDGMEALARLRAEPVDLVVSDVDMPRLDGFDLTAEIRRDAALRHLPVVLVTSLGDQAYRERGVAVGADAYIVKSSFDQDQLLTTIGRLL